jgi:hypothetical protein
MSRSKLISVGPTEVSYSRFPDCPGRPGWRASSGKLLHAEEKSPALRNEYGNRKGFIRGRGEPGSRADLSRNGVGGETALLDTEPATRILSWKAIFWAPCGRVLGISFVPCENNWRRAPWEGCVEQEADGSWVAGMDAGWGEKHSLVCGNRALLPKPGPEVSGSQDRSRRQNLTLAPVQGRVCLKPRAASHVCG